MYAMPGITQSVRKAGTNVGPLNSAWVIQGLMNGSLLFMDTKYCLSHIRVRGSV